MATKPIRSDDFSVKLTALLPEVSPKTIKQYHCGPQSFEMSLADLTHNNYELVLWIRFKATELFPDDLAARRNAIKLTLDTLNIIQNQKLIELLASHYGA